MRRLLFAVLAAGLLAGCAPEETGRTPVVMIGIDGAEWNVIDAMIAEGELPHLARIKREGAWGYLLNPGPAVSPVVWTTFATGHFGRRHGILAHTWPYDGGAGQRPVSSDLRQVPALWNVASHYGLRSVVLGYFVTHPAENIDGVMVSPRAPRGVPGSIAPPDALDLDAERYRELGEREVQQGLWSRYLGWAYDPRQADEPGSPYQEPARIVNERNIHKRIVEDEFLRRAALDLVEEPADLFIAYYRLPDFMSHSLWLYYDDSDFADPADPEAKALFGEAVTESYRFVDEAVGELLERFNGQANVMIVSDHGFGASLKMERGKETRSSHLTGDHRPNGVVLATGPDIAPGELRGMTIMEVAPTLAALLGVPVADELPGKVEARLLRPGYLEKHPLMSVPDYAQVTVERTSAALDAAAEDEDLASLRGLGYIGEGVVLDDSTATGDYDFWSTEKDTLAKVLATEVLYYLLEGDRESAEEIVALVRDRRPRLVEALIRRTSRKFSLMQRQLPKGYLDASTYRQFMAEHRPRAQPGDGA